MSLRAVWAARASLLAVLAVGVAHAQTAPPAAPEPVPEPAPPGEPAPYQDRVIEGLAPAPVDDNEAGGRSYDASGWPRLLRLETRLGNQAFDTERRTRLALALYGLIDTPNHGAISIDGSVTPSERSGSLTIRQRGLPLEGGWLAHHEAGVIGSPATGLARQPSRVYLPTTTVLGASGEWSHSARGLSLMAGSGQPGRLQGQPGNGFAGIGGRRTTLAAQWRPFEASDPANPFAPPGAARLPGLTLALQHERASDLSATSTGAAASAPLGAGANATLLAARFERDTLRLQAQAMGSQTDAGASSATSPRTSARGYWLDTEWDQGPRTHGLSLYRLEPGLRWAGQAMPDDLQGLALKTGWRTRQWSADAAIDWLDAISGARASGSYASASARWRLNRRESVGIGGAVRHFGGNAWNSYADWRFENSWGNSGLRLEANGGANSTNRGQRLSFDQEWAVPQGFSLATSLGLGRETPRADSDTLVGTTDTTPITGTNTPENLWSAAIALGAPLGQRAQLSGTLRTEHSNRGRRDHSLSLGTLWRIHPAWTFETQYNRSLGRRSATVASLDPLAPIAQDTTTTDGDHTLYAVLRYETQAGSRRIPLGGSASEGGGRIEGTVFFDANNSGVQEASETGVTNALVYLDNRYAVRTDAQGRFEFPLVAPGPRTITLRNDSLPLPWSAPDEGQARIDVRLRESTRLMLPVQKN
jgi:hypothetical protein